MSEGLIVLDMWLGLLGGKLITSLKCFGGYRGKNGGQGVDMKIAVHWVDGNESAGVWTRISVQITKL